ncbi:MAG: 2-amino-4-hydroxy-6-hydroxymethyldihydropteridine diphosphokinase [Peptococcaceae bacterium]|jgi:2-amino-4-hydroxy-6-hydroxymethyldihydropteridine diphosphokinase|nr:2-amino-4-hydroxy-6-hydroxymethyldihydropteridine diphosphokinase [Peptococcaceae bacterium]
MICYLSLGSNVGDRQQYLTRAMDLLAKLPNSRITKISAFYETEAWGGVKQNSFINNVVEFQTTLSPEQLLAECQNIENSLGRQRSVHWGPRTIDIDILIYGDLKFTSDKLIIPHPYLEVREFVLAPLREIAPDLILPSGRSVTEVKGEGKVKLLN